jgi:hypothetical protein
MVALKRERWAALVYRMEGASIPFRGDDGSYQSFQPTAADLKEWSQTQKVNQQMMLKHQQSRMLVLNALIDMVMFFVIVTGGIFITCYRRMSVPHAAQGGG